MPRGDRGGTCRGIGSRCVAANCGNTNFNGFSLHTFPRDPALRKKWTDFVKTKRVWDGPKEYSMLCSAHFTRDCFPFRYLFEKEQMGLTPPGQLNKDAVPTIHASVTADPATPSTSSGQKLDMLSPKEEILSQSSPPKKLRRGYLKREAKRLISAYEQMKPSTASVSVVDVESTWDETGLMEDSEVVGNTASVSCQVKPTVVSKQCQTKARKTENKRTVIKMVSKGVQTEAVKTNTRDAFQLVKPEFFDKKPRHKRCDTTAEDFPVQSYLSPMKDDPNDPNYEPPSSPMSDGICSESAEEGIEETFPSVRPESERKFIVFEDLERASEVTYALVPSPYWGNCFTFVQNALPKNEPDIKLFINLDAKENVFGGKAEGYVFLQEKDILTFPDFFPEPFVTLEAGYKFLIRIKMETIVRLNGRYRQCSDFEETFSEEAGVRYSRDACKYMCPVLYSLRRCGCVLKDMSYLPADYNTLKVIENAANCTQAKSGCYRHVQDRCYSDCKVRCVMKRFVVTNIQKIELPSSNCEHWQECMEKENETDRQNWMANNAVELLIKFPQRENKIYRQVPAYPLSQFLPDIGGTLGMYLGVSLLTLAEIPQLLIGTVVFFVNKNLRRKNKV